MPNWDYASNAAYFITICTKDRDCYFWEIKNGEMIMNDVGQIANECWLAIPEYFPFAKLGNHVIMPNHVHGIVIIDKPNIKGNDERNVGTRLIASLPPKPMKHIKTDADKPNGGITGNYNPMLHDNLSKIIRWYKGRTSFETRKINPEFAWQSRFHDHIIRNDESFQRISNYIKNNPSKWKEDVFF
ncbi:transposase [Antarcticibacterium flavum]|uniref:transposase n=1 Tax=Antarcticibacterium flavum TaxID=2058175 RepID=UPI001C551543|nr:transposase [Antarcticibacterium flavum]